MPEDSLEQAISQPPSLTASEVQFRIQMNEMEVMKPALDRLWAYYDQGDTNGIGLNVRQIVRKASTPSPVILPPSPTMSRPLSNQDSTRTGQEVDPDPPSLERMLGVISRHEIFLEQDVARSTEILNRALASVRSLHEVAKIDMELLKTHVRRYASALANRTGEDGRPPHSRTSVEVEIAGPRKSSSGDLDASKQGPQPKSCAPITISRKETVRLSEGANSTASDVSNGIEEPGSIESDRKVEDESCSDAQVDGSTFRPYGKGVVIGEGQKDLECAQDGPLDGRYGEHGLSDIDHVNRISDSPRHPLSCSGLRRTRSASLGSGSATLDTFNAVKTSVNGSASASSDMAKSCSAGSSDKLNGVAAALESSTGQERHQIAVNGVDHPSPSNLAHSLQGLAKPTVLRPIHPASENLKISRSPGEAFRATSAYVDLDGSTVWPSVSHDSRTRLTKRKADDAVDTDDRRTRPREV